MKIKNNDNIKLNGNIGYSSKTGYTVLHILCDNPIGNNDKFNDEILTTSRCVEICKYILFLHHYQAL